MKWTRVSKEQGYTAFDLDGTLAYYTHWVGKEHIGEPIPKMLDKVKSLLDNGERVKIFTARAADPQNIPYIEQWLETKGIGGLEITNVKDMFMKELYDDRCKQVITNTGEVVGEVSVPKIS